MFATLMTRQQHQFLSGIAWGGSKLPTSESGFFAGCLDPVAGRAGLLLAALTDSRRSCLW
jgi:hypothetical protein